MNYSLIFSINETEKFVNEDIIVTITPPSNILKYEYTIIKDNVENKKVIVTNNKNTEILLDETGLYSIEVNLYDENLNEITVSSGFYKIDKEKPIINVQNKNLEIKLGDEIHNEITAYDEIDGNLTEKITSNYDTIDFSKTGLKKITYTVTDEAGNTTETIVNVNVYPNKSSQLLFFGGIIIFTLVIFFILMIRYLKSIRLDKRISKYAIEPINEKEESIFDKFFIRYKKLVSKISKYLEKSVFLSKYGKKYEKYIGTIDKNYTKGIEFVTSKLFMSIIFLIIAVFAKTIQGNVLNLYEVIFPMIFGFFLLDIIYFSKYKVYRSKLENDLLQAIIIMNNAFKSGRSITQAIDLVSNQLDGPMSLEFKKMSLEISFGLSIEEVFRRFSKRIQLEEVAYLTASLSILNKTGGNIIKVFSSIEKNLFSKKKLKLELNSLTGSSRIIVYVLFIVPIIFVLFISLIDNEYFLPLINNPLGIIITIAILIFYAIYICVIRKIMKVRM